MPALTVPQLCRLAVAAAADREASYVAKTPSEPGRYSRSYHDSVERTLARERLTATPQEINLIYILAACGEACDYAQAYLGTPPA